MHARLCFTSRYGPTWEHHLHARCHADWSWLHVQYYKGEWTFYPSAESEFDSLTASRDLIETSCRKQLLALAHNVRICGGEPVQELLWAEDRSSVHGASPACPFLLC